MNGDDAAGRLRRRLRRRFPAGTSTPVLPSCARAQGDRQDAFDGPDGAGEREFADHDEIVELIGSNLFAGGEHADGDGQIEAGPFFLHIGGREVDGGAAER